MAIEKVPKLHNKGVHAPPTDSNLSSSKDDEDRSLTQIKKDVKAVIELMGPNTPHFEQIASMSESTFPNSTTIDKKDSKVLDDPNYQTDNDFSTLPPDIPVHDTDFSIMVDDPTTYTQQCICPPPTFPANYIYNSECICPQMEDYFQSKYQKACNKTISEKSNFLHSFYNFFKEKKNAWSRKGDFYTINVKQSTNFGLPTRLVFDLVEDNCKETNQDTCENGICNNCFLKKESFYSTTQKDSKTRKTEDTKHGLMNLLPDNINSKLKFNQKTMYTDDNGANRVDVYYFDHGCSNYFRTTDKSPILATEALAERTEAYTTKFWAELFGTFNIGFSFLTSFILQFLRFILYTIVRPLTVGIFQLLSDYLFKPILCAIFNALIQPILIFLFNVAGSVRDFCDPIAEAMGYFIRELSAPIRAFRFVEVRKETPENSTLKRSSKRTFKKNRILLH